MPNASLGSLRDGDGRRENPTSGGAGNRGLDYASAHVLFTRRARKTDISLVETREVIGDAEIDREGSGRGADIDLIGRDRDRGQRRRSDIIL